MVYRAPLSELLTRALAGFTAEFEQRLAGAGHGDLSLALGSNVLRFLDGSGVRLGALADLAGVTKQAISQQVAYLEAHGYVAVESDPADSRAKLVLLTGKGRRSREVARPLFGVVERDWRQRFGRDEIRRLREALDVVVGQLADTD